MRQAIYEQVYPATQLEHHAIMVGYETFGISWEQCLFLCLSINGCVVSNYVVLGNEEGQCLPMYLIGNPDLAIIPKDTDYIYKIISRI